MTISPLLAPAFTFVLIFMLVYSFLEKLIEADWGEKHRPLSQVAESRWILLANIFSAHGVPIGAEPERRQVVALPQTRSRVRARLLLSAAIENFLRGMLCHPQDLPGHGGNGQGLGLCAQCLSTSRRADVHACQLCAAH